MRASLSKTLFFLFSLSFFLFSPKLVRGTWSRGFVLSCQLSSHHWLIWISSHPLSIIVDFHPLRRCHMSTWAPLGSPYLTNSALDTWHTVSHSPHAKCPVPLFGALKNGEFQLFLNSTKFNVVIRFREMIPTVKSVSSSEI